MKISSLIKGGDNMIRVNEIFGPTIQGEGKSAGLSVIFIRLAGCNLACNWCDTPYAWNYKGSKHSHPIKFSAKDEIHLTSVLDIVEKITETNVKNIVISGGEPLLQQDSLVPLLFYLYKSNYWIEIETNGTITPTDEVIEYVDQFNCSPKLSNSGGDVKQRIVSDALQKLSLSGKTNFKFVVAKKSDIDEIIYLTSLFQMKEVYLMAEGKTKEEQVQNSEYVEKMAHDYHFSFSPRLHILRFNTKRGV